MISSDDASNRPVQTQIVLTVSDLVEIKDYANRAFHAHAVPKELENSEYLVLCYAKGVDRVLNKKGFNINLTFTTKLPYSSIEE